MTPATREEQLASEYGREIAARQRRSADFAIERVAQHIAWAFEFMRADRPFEAGEYLATASHMATQELYYLDEYTAASALLRAARSVLTWESTRRMVPRVGCELKHDASPVLVP